MSAIGVGFDGSNQARAALRWAAEEAALRHAPLRVVTAVQGTPPVTLWGAPAPARVSDEEVAETRRRVEEAVAATLDESGRDGSDEEAKVEVVVRAGHPSAVLIQESSSCSLLVIGSTGVGGFVESLLGSVSGTVIARARCPVTIVR